MAAGRNFSAEESRPGDPQAVIFGHRFWQPDSAAVEHTLQVEGTPGQVVGLLPADFP